MTLRHLPALPAALLLLAVPTTGLAQAKARPAAATTAKAVPAAKAAAPVPAPAPTPEPEPSPGLAPIAEVGSTRADLSVGYEKDSDADLGGLRLQLDLEHDLVALGSRGQLSFVAVAGWFHATKTTTLGVSPYTTDVDTTLDFFELVPSFRASVALVPRIRLFAQVGVGGGWGRSRSVTTSSALPGVSAAATADDFAGVLRLSAGGSFQVTDRLRAGVELPTFTRRYGAGIEKTLSFTAMAAYAF